MWKRDFFLDIIFPKFCLNCGREGDYLCEDCQGLLDISGFHQTFSTKNLKDLYFPLSYQNFLVKKIIHQFKYQPFIKELSKTLASLIIEHFQLLDNKPDFFPPSGNRSYSNGTNFILIPIPSTKKRLKWRGFNQTEEIGKELALFLKIPLISDCLMKIKEISPQVELSDEERKENIKNAFSCRDSGKIKGKRIVLVDDVFTTGSTMEECARILKGAGAKEIIGVILARG